MNKRYCNFTIHNFSSLKNGQNMHNPGLQTSQLFHCPDRELLSSQEKTYKYRCANTQLLFKGHAPKCPTAFMSALVDSSISKHSPSQATPQFLQVISTNKPVHGPSATLLNGPMPVIIKVSISILNYFPYAIQVAGKYAIHELTG